MSRLPAAAGATLAGLVALGCGFGSPTVVRVVDGEPIEGRFIDSVTYAFYARGAYHEARGELDAATRAFQAASERDPESPAIWTRLGSVLCRARRAGDERAFGLAQDADPEFAPLWYERARCALERGQIEAAVAHARKAVHFEPRDEDNSLLLARALERAGRIDEALRHVTALALARPGATAAWKLLAEIAGRHGRRSEAHRAELALLTSISQTRSIPRRRALADELESVDAALGAGELERARRLAIESGIRPDELALRAAALGAARIAADQAELVLAADPTNGNAWIAALVAADLRGDSERFRDALVTLASDAQKPEALGARLMADLLARRVGADAARAWLAAYGPLPEPSDALERRVAARLDPRS